MRILTNNIHYCAVMIYNFQLIADNGCEVKKQVSDYDQEMPQSHTASEPIATVT